MIKKFVDAFHRLASADDKAKIVKQNQDNSCSEDQRVATPTSEKTKPILDSAIICIAEDPPWSTPSIHRPIQEIEEPPKITEADIPSDCSPFKRAFLEFQISQRKKYEESEFYKRKEAKKRSDEAIANCLHIASAADYAEWLKLYLAAGGKIDREVSFDFNYFDKIYIATKSCDVGNLYGSSSLNIIEPPGITVKAGGHCKVYHSDFPLDTSRFFGISIYPDVKKILMEDES